MGDKDDTTPARATSAVAARRGYIISRIEAPPTATGNSSLNFGASSTYDRGGYDAPLAADNKHQHKGGAGRGGDSSVGKEGGRGRKKRGGKGGKTAHAAAAAAAATASPSGRVDTKAKEPRGGLDRTAASSQRPAHQQASKDDGGGFGGAHKTVANATGRDRDRRQYHHEHDDRAETRTPLAGERPAFSNPRQPHQHHHRPQAESTAVEANRSKTAVTAAHSKKPSHIKGRGNQHSGGKSGGGGGGGGGSILNRLGSPPTSPRTAAHAKTNPNNTRGNTSIFSKIGSPPPSPRNALSRTDANSSKGHDRVSAHRSNATTLARSYDGATEADRLIPGHLRGPLPHPPAAATTTTTKGGHEEHQEQRWKEESGNTRKHGVGGGSASSLSSGRVANSSAQSKRAGHQRNDGSRGDKHRGGPGTGEREVLRASGGRAMYHSVGDARSNGRWDRSADSSDIAQHRQQQQQEVRRKQGHREQPPQPRPHQHQQDKYARGTCMSMCPDSEREEREAEGGLSSFEATTATSTPSVPFRQRVADPNKTVKKYRRSAAGRDMHSPQQLRPLAVLQTTAQYLVQEVFATACSRSSSSSSNSSNSQPKQQGGSSPSSMAKAYVFVEDRLRAVRQDLTVQGLVLEGTAGAAEVLKTTANFYIVAGYLMSDETTDVFDRHLHTRELQGVFSSLAELFFQARRVEVAPHSPQYQYLGADEYLCLQAVHALATAISNSNGSQGGDTQLGDAAGDQGVGRVFTTTVSRLCSTSSSSLPRPTKQSDGNGGYEAVASAERAEAVEGGVVPPLPFRRAFPKMAMAVRLLGVVLAGNWSEFFRMLGSALSPPSDGLLLVGDELALSSFAVRLRCLCHGMLLPVRTHALRAMNRAYGKSERVPLTDIAKMLRARDEEHVAGICRALSLPIEGTGDEKKDSNHKAGAKDKDQATAVVFKFVPAVWKSQAAKKTGYLCRTDDGNAPGSSSLREDGWVGLTRALAAAVPNKKDGDINLGSNKSGTETATCTACAGFGCSWCDNGVVKVDEEALIGEEEEGLWQAALCPT